MNPYERCPVYRTEHFLLRQVAPDDAESLLECYSDPTAVANMNADNCTNGFYMTTVEEIGRCIGFWLREYAAGYYVRLAVIDRATDRTIGTVEIFGGKTGVLRIDLPVSYEKQEILEELLALAKKEMRLDFPMDRMCFKAHMPVRRAAAQAQGFVASSYREGGGYYEY